MIKVFIFPECQEAHLVSSDSDVYWDSGTGYGVKEYSSFAHFVERNLDEAKYVDHRDILGVFGFSYNQACNWFQVLCNPSEMKSLAVETLEKDYPDSGCSEEENNFVVCAEENYPEYAVAQWALLTETAHEPEFEMIVGTFGKELELYQRLLDWPDERYAEICGVELDTFMSWINESEVPSYTLKDEIRDAILQRMSLSLGWV